MHRGRIFNTAGDAILAEFASAVEAVRCATDIQSALRTRNDQLPPARQVRFRIGINLGDVMLQGLDLMGDGVNVAARLQTAAEPGGICISGSVDDQITNKLSLSFQPMGAMSFKNISQPVRTFSITAADGVPAFPRLKLSALFLRNGSPPVSACCWWQAAVIGFTAIEQRARRWPPRSTGSRRASQASLNDGRYDECIRDNSLRATKTRKGTLLQRGGNRQRQQN